MTKKIQLFKIKYYELGMGVFLFIVAGFIIIDSSLKAFNTFIYIILGVTINVLVATVLSFLILLSLGVLFKPKGMKMLYLISWVVIFMIISIIALRDSFLIKTILEETLSLSPEEIATKLQPLAFPIVMLIILINIALIFHRCYQHRKFLITDSF